MGELSDITDFLGKVHTTATVKHYSEVRNISNIEGSKRMLVFPPEIMGHYLNVIIKRYKVKISETSETSLMTALNNILDGIDKLNKRETISDYTKPGTLVHAAFVSGNKAYENSNNQRWDQDIYLEFEWATS